MSLPEPEDVEGPVELARVGEYSLVPVDIEVPVSPSSMFYLMAMDAGTDKM
ncbi:hypothetical protein NG798_24440 [Ancylothrix sp. C2]|nr:hypothetical protein [Ancylothrix sp. D3o]